MIDTGKLRAVIAKATPGEWAWETPMGEHCPWIVQGGKQAYEWKPLATLGDCIEDGPNPHSKAFRAVQGNAAYIATFDPPTTTALLDTIDTLSQQLAEARKAAFGIGQRVVYSLGQRSEFADPLDRSEAVISATVIGNIEGWYEIEFDSDNSRVVVKPSSIRALASEASHD